MPDPCIVLRVANRRPPRLDPRQYRGLRRYFLTICTHERRRWFTCHDRVDAVRTQLLRTASGYAFEVVAYCFMPDHLHVLAEGQDDSADFLKLASMFKQRSAYEHKNASGGRLWQDGYYDRILREEESNLAVAAYIIRNPVAAGICEDLRSYNGVGSSQYTIEQLLEAVAWRP